MDVSAPQLTIIKLNSSFQITTLIIPHLTESKFIVRHLETYFFDLGKFSGISVVLTVDNGKAGD